MLGYEGATAALLVVTDGANTWRWTDYDTAIDAGELGVFTPLQIEVGEITEEINLAEHGTTLDLRAFAGCPFFRLLDESDSAELSVAIYTCDPDTPAATLERLFTAKATAAKLTGPFLNVTLAGFNALFDQKGPRQLMQDTCCAVFGDEKCGMANAGVAFTVAALATGAIDFTLPAGVTTVAAFAYGYAERTLAAGGTQRWAIRTAVLVDGLARVTLSGAVSPAAAVGDTWTLYRGCACTWEACQAHGNAINFRGFPYIPTRNPSMVAVTSTTSGKK